MKPAFESLETRNLLSTLGLATIEGDGTVPGEVATRIVPVADISTALPSGKIVLKSRVIVTVSNGILSVIGTPADDVVQVSNPDPATVRVAVGTGRNTVNYNFPATAVNRIVFEGLDGNDSFVNLTAIDSVQDGGGGNDALQSGGGNDVLLGREGNDTLTDTGGNNTLDGGDGDDILQSGSGNDVLLGRGGNDILTDTGGRNTLDGGDGQDNIWGFGNDVIFGGAGDDTIYSIVGTSFLDGGAGNDRVITNGVSTNVADVADRPAVVFKTRATPVTLDNGVLYFAGDAMDNLVTLTQDSNNKIFVTYRDASGTSIQSFSASQVTQIAGILGAGNDTVINNTNIDGVFYGVAGNDVLIGGGGNDLLKGGGDNDVLIGGVGNDDLTGDLGTDYLEGGAGIDTLRAGFDRTDTLVAEAIDIVLGDPLVLILVPTPAPAPVPTPIPTRIRRLVPLELPNLTYDAVLPLI
jgi:Ca2+-binding RTX toxin-like protein